MVGTDRGMDSNAIAVDWTLPIIKYLIFRGEGFTGANLVPFDGGIEQGVALVPAAGATPAQIRKIRDQGGWVELISPVTPKDILYAGAGTDDPRDSDLLPGGANRSKNSFVWASYFRKLGPDVTAAFEWSFWDFRTRTFIGPNLGPRGTSGRGNVVNIALAYQF
jgi:hypothetical protein